MYSTGIVRKTDKLGRIVIPKEIRKNFAIKKDDYVEIFVDGEMIILKKTEDKTKERLQQYE